MFHNLYAEVYMVYVWKLLNLVHELYDVDIPWYVYVFHGYQFLPIYVSPCCSEMVV